MLFSIPKLDNGKMRRDSSIWLLIFAGHDQTTDMMKFELVFGWCPDLMHPQLDRGRAIPALLALQWKWFGPETRAMLGVGPEVKYRWRSDWKEIYRRLDARRLANADV